MAELTAFVSHLLETGEARLRAAPALSLPEQPAVLALLARAHAEDALELAGPPLPFAPQAALAAAQFLAWSCWFLLQHDQPPDVVAANLLMPPPHTPGDHLSADICLRFTAAVHRRARAASPQDILTQRLDQTLRHWPLSGALADIAAPPNPLPDFGGHPGLLLLLAERLANHPRAAWLAGPVAPVAELVFHQRRLVFHVPPMPDPALRTGDVP